MIIIRAAVKARPIHTTNNHHLSAILITRNFGRKICVIIGLDVRCSNLKANMIGMWPDSEKDDRIPFIRINLTHTQKMIHI